VIICGYGRIGQSVGHFLEEEQIPFVALDLDPARVRKRAPAASRCSTATRPSATSSRPSAWSARLLVISHDDVGAALKGAAARARGCDRICR
jgi:monovalent cation:H+ antiporter-2, CPA2 family